MSENPSLEEALPKTYDPLQVEGRWYSEWEKAGYFHAEDASEKPPYCIVIPPPNVTGFLHLGHALTVSVEDLLIRWKRMSGFNALWMPGTDHAGIATQLVVERELKATEGKTRQDLGREEFQKRIWAWKAKSGGRITQQLRTLGVPSTGRASASPWTKASPARCGRCSCGSTRRGCSTAPRSSSTGARAAGPR